MKAWLGGVRGRVTFTVLAVSAVLFSLIGTFGFIQVASNGTAAVRERVNEVVDQLEAAIRAGSATTQISTVDGVVASIQRERPIARASEPVDSSEIRVQRSVRVGTHKLQLVGRSSQARVTDSLRSLYHALWIAIPLGSLASAIMAGMATHRALRPVAAITQLAETIGDGTELGRVPVPNTGDEVERLAATVNGMLDRIDEGRRTQRRFTADAAHELRTPLMALSGEIDLLPSSVDSERLRRLCARLGTRIDDLILLAILDEGRPLRLRSTNLCLRDLAEDEAAIVSPSVLVSGSPVEIDGDQELLARAIRNLVANAARHSASQVSVLVEEHAGRVWLHVDDDGPGLASEKAEIVFERFSRLDEARESDGGGSGLGLAIVASVAKVHHGGVAAVSIGPLGGARVSFWVSPSNRIAAGS